MECLRKSYLLVLGMVSYGGIFLAKLLSPAFGTLLGQWDLRLSPWILWALLASIPWLGWFARNDWKDFFGKLSLDRKWLGIAGGLILVTILGIALSVHAQPRIESNESIIRSTAQNLHAHWTAGACDEGLFDGRFLDCLSSSNTWQPKLPPVLYSLGLWVLPSHLHWAYAMQLMILALLGILAFLAVQAWSANPFLALLTSVLQVSQPLVAFHSRSVSSELWYLVCFWMVLLFWKIAEDKLGRIHWILLGVSLGLWGNTDNSSWSAILPLSILIISGESAKRHRDRWVYFPLVLLFSLLPLAMNQAFFLHTDPVWAGAFSFAKLFHGLGNIWRTMALVGVDNHGYLRTPYLSTVTWVAVSGMLILFFRKGKFALDGRFLGALVFCGFPFLWDLGRANVSVNSSWIQWLSLYGFPLLCTLAAFAIQQVFAWTSPLPPRDLSISPSPVWGIAMGILLVGISLRYYNTYRSNHIFLGDARTEEEHMLQAWIELHQETPRLLVYSSPWFFVGQGQSAIHYSRFLNMDTGGIAQLIQRYHGEVYSVRGLDCQSSKQQEAIASLCGSMEQAFYMEPVFQEAINNEYQLTVQRVKGLLQYEPDSLAQIKQVTYQPETMVMEVRYRLSEQVPQGWHIKIQVGGAHKTRPFAVGNYVDTLSVASWQPGFHDVRIFVYDLNGSLRASQVYSVFESQKGAFVPLTELPLISKRQSWGELQQNTSTNQNTLSINGALFGAGIGTHAYAVLEYDLGGKYSRFSAIWGHDDEEPNGDGLQFEVLGDGKVLWQSDPLHAPLACATKTCAKGCEKMEGIKTKTSDTADINVSGVHTLTIRVDSLTNNASDHADIANPVLVRAPSPESISSIP